LGLLYQKLLAHGDEKGIPGGSCRDHGLLDLHWKAIQQSRKRRADKQEDNATNRAHTAPASAEENNHKITYVFVVEIVGISEETAASTGRPDILQCLHI
jgi:hypothetical protein